VAILTKKYKDTGDSTRIALAAYNGGEGNVNKAVAAAKKKKKDMNDNSPVTWLEVKAAFEPGMIKTETHNGKVYFGTAAEKKAKMKQIIDYVPKVMQYYASLSPDAKKKIR
jgi:membrane-bound lytic murein transglycosylase MltF